jgi:hypothetical protein
MQREFQEGEKARAACETCRVVSDMTFRRRDVVFSDGSGVVPDLLAGVCDTCDEVICIPASSTEDVRRAH